MSYITRAGVEEMSDNSWIDQTLMTVHRGKCRAQYFELGTNELGECTCAVKGVKAAIELHLQQEVKLAEERVIRYATEGGSKELVVKHVVICDICKSITALPEIDTNTRDGYIADQKEGRTNMALIKQIVPEDVDEFDDIVYEPTELPQ